MSELRDRIAEAACGATSAGKLFPWETLSTANRQPWYLVADAVIEALGRLGADVKRATMNDITPLGVATGQGHTAAMEALIQLGAT